MSWFKRKKVDAIPNPRDKKRKRDNIYMVQRAVLDTLIFLDFSLALLIALEVAH